MEAQDVIHLFHFVTALSYFVVGGIFFACGRSATFRFSLLRNEADRTFVFMMTGVFVYACFLDHFADSMGADTRTLIAVSAFEALVSLVTALFLAIKVTVQWRG